MKITMYELLGLVKDGKAPERILYDNYIWSWTGDDYQTILKNEKEQFLITGMYYTWVTEFLNDTVEIIEEEPKPITKESIEALGYACGEIRKLFENGWNKSLENKPLIEDPKKIEKITVREKTLGFPNGEWTARNMDKAFAIKINELIDEINNLKEND